MLLEFALGAVAVGALGGTLYYAHKLDVARTAAWQRAAERLGLRFVPNTFWKPARINGVAGDFEVVFDTYTVSTGKSASTFTRLRVTGFEASMVLEAEGALSGLTKIFTGADLATGDKPFDDAVLLRGSQEDALRAALDVTTRELAARGVGELKMKIRGGILEIVHAGLVRDEAKIVSVVSFALDLARRLKVSSDAVAARLVALAKGDPVAEVRVQALSALVVRHRASPDARPFFADADPAELEATFLAALAPNRDPRVRAAAAEALAIVGSLGAVERLLAAGEDGRVKPAASRAIAAIQQREGVGERGGLALASEAGGELSLDPRGGELSKPK